MKFLQNRRHIPKVLFLVFITFLGMTGLQCKEGKKENWMARVQFADSTYIKAKENYVIGDTIYVLGSHIAQACVPETTEIILRSKIGDKETILATYPSNMVTEALTSVRGGQIKCEGKTTPTVENGVMEVNLQYDTITVYYDVKGNIATDTAYIEPGTKKEGAK